MVAKHRFKSLVKIITKHIFKQIAVRIEFNTSKFVIRCFCSLIFLLTLNFETTYGQQQQAKLTISPLTSNAFIYITNGDPGDGSLFPANGMYLVTPAGAILFDTPWDTTQLQPLLDTIMQRHGKRVIMCLSTHFHSDRTAGLSYYSKLGIKTYTTRLTDSILMARHIPRASNIIYSDTAFNIGRINFETYYPGKGHSPDNIVIWIPQEKILYGGCFIKSLETNSIGNLSDADIGEWSKSLERVEKKFPAVKYVIPGHQGGVSKEAIHHTKEIIENYKTHADH